MKKLFKWFLMLSKRIYKKPSFVVLLILIPFCVSLFSIAAKQDSGFLHIVLAQEDANDRLANEVIQELSTESSIIRFTVADSPQAAIDAVTNSGADEAWIFPAETEKKLDEFLDGTREYVISVVSKEQNNFLRLSREKLTGALYKYCARSFYIDYTREKCAELNHLSDQQLLTYFDNVSITEELFVFGNPANRNDDGSETNYLTSPIRGLLSIFAVLCGMAAAMYYMQDEANGTFAHVKQRLKGMTEFGCIATAVFNVSIVLLLSLVLSSLAGNIFRELLVLFLYIFCCTAFCFLLRRIFTTLRSYASMIPLLTVIFIGICPVFFDFRSLSALQNLFPPTYYVNALYNDRYLLYMLVYMAACLALSFLLQTLRSALKALKLK